MAGEAVSLGPQNASSHALTGTLYILLDLVHICGESPIDIV
jgi:hypothetical protein